MSFGFSISDIITLTQLTARTYDGWKNACGDYANITSDLAIFQMLLVQVKAAAEAPNSLFTHNPDDLKGWETLYKGCCRQVVALEEILDKYKSLRTTRRKKWDRIRMGNRNLDSLSRRLVKQTASLSAFLSVLGIRSQGRVENEVFPGILQRMDHIAAQRRNGNASSSTAMTAYDNDDRAVWREFRKEMTSAGIPSSDIRKYSAAIRTYLARLQREGLLDEEELPNTAISGGAPAQTLTFQSSSSGHDSQLPVRDLKRILEDTDNIGHSKNCSNVTEDNSSRDAGQLGVQEVETKKQARKLIERKMMAMYTLAVTHWFQCNYEKAEKLGLEVLEGQEWLLGSEHPNTLLAMEHLGLTYSSQGRWKEAEEKAKQVLEIRERILGPEHPDTLFAMHNLALVYGSQNREDRGFSLMEECYKLSTLNLGPRNPCTESSRQALETLAVKDDENTNLVTGLCTIPRHYQGEEI